MLTYRPVTEIYSMKLKGIVPRTWRLLKKIFLILFVAQLLYIILLRWVNPPFTTTMIGSWFSLLGSDKSFKRDYVNLEEMSDAELDELQAQFQRVCGARNDKKTERTKGVRCGETQPAQEASKSPPAGR